MPDIVADGDNLGDHIATKSFKQIKGSDVASGDAVTLGFGGNTFDITGTTTINHINNTNWVVGSVVILHFDGAVTLTHNAGGLSGNEANILLSGDANFTTATGDILTFLLHDSTNWQEISRNSVASIPDDSITNAKLSTGIDAVKLADGSVTNAEFQHINSLSANAQDQINLKAPLASPTFTGTVTTSAQTINGNTTQGDGYKAIFGNGSDLDIYHTGGNNLWYGNSGNQLFYTPSSTFHRFLVNNVAIVDIDSGGIDVNGNIQMGTGAKITNIKNLQHEISTSGVDIDFSEDQLQTISIASNTTFTTTNRAVGLSKTIRIITDGTIRTLAFPSDWKFIGSKPTEQAASKTGILTLTNFGTTDAYIVAAYAVEE